MIRSMSGPPMCTAASLSSFAQRFEIMPGAQDLDFQQPAVGERDIEGVAALAADERKADGGEDRDPSARGVCRLRIGEHYRATHSRGVLAIGYARAHRHPIGGQLIGGGPPSAGPTPPQPGAG